MLEYASYSHTWSTTGTVDQVETNKITRWYLNLVDNTPDNVGGTISSLVTYPAGSGLRIFWASLNTSWTSLRIGPSSSNYTTLARSAMSVNGNLHYIIDSVTYITNSASSPSMYFELII